MSCEKCGNDKITYYKQRRIDGVMVVTARCKNGHSPIKGNPFYPISQFDIASLPILPEQKDEQPELFVLAPKREKQFPPEMDPIEFKRSIQRDVWERLNK